MSGIKTDCIFFKNKTDKGCNALTSLQCYYGKCNFYKSKEEFKPDGTRKIIRKQNKTLP